MDQLDNNTVHALLAALIPAIGGVFIFLLKRTFSDFETKLATLFSDLKATLDAQNKHETRLQLLEHKVAEIKEELDKE